MAAVFNHAVKQSQLVKRDLEKFSVAPEEAPPSLPGQISSSLTGLQRAIESYEASAANELVPEKKEQALERIQKLKEDLASGRQELKQLRARREESIATQHRQELFARRQALQTAGTNSDAATASENPYAGAPNGGGHIDRHDGLAREHDALSRAGQQLDEFIEYSRQALGDLTEQNSVLRNAGQTMKNVAGTLGMSQETIRRVERRAREDKAVFYGLAACLLVSFYLIVRWLR